MLDVRSNINPRKSQKAKKKTLNQKGANTSKDQKDLAVNKEDLFQKHQELDT